jgi:hypothetical protein
MISIPDKTKRELRAEEILLGLKDLVDTRVNHDHYEYDSDIRKSINSLYLLALVAGRDTDKNLNPKKRVLENKFYDGARYLLQHECPLEKIKEWTKDAFNSYHKDSEGILEINEMKHVYNKPLGRREKIVGQFLNNFSSRINDYKQQENIWTRIPLVYCLSAIEAVQSTVNSMCPSIVRSYRMKCRLNALGTDFDCKYRRKEFSKIPQ